MKKLFTLLLISFGATPLFAQYKIVITYDQNGSRIQRSMVCSTCRSTNEIENDPAMDTSKSSFVNKSIEWPSNGNEIGTFKVFPNPTDNKVQVELDAISLQQRCELVLTDISGRVHYRKITETELTTIPLESLADGVYFISLFRGTEKNVVKIVKSRR